LNLKRLEPSQGAKSADLVSHAFPGAWLFVSPPVKNTDYVIRIATKRGRSWTYAKEADAWTQTTPAARVRRMTAEQLLSHLLPPLAKDQPHLNVTVEAMTSRPQPDAKGI
jgi:hypothetical protein